MGRWYVGRQPDDGPANVLRLAMSLLMLCDAVCERLAAVRTASWAHGKWKSCTGASAHVTGDLQRLLGESQVTS